MPNYKAFGRQPALKTSTTYTRRGSYSKKVYLIETEDHGTDYLTSGETKCHLATRLRLRCKLITAISCICMHAYWFAVAAVHCKTSSEPSQHACSA